MRLPSILYPVEQAFRYLYGALPFSWRAGAQYRRLRRFLSEAQWWDAERIREWQTERLGWMIRYAYENVPGYRHLYEKAGITPADFRTLEDLPAFPLLEKSFVQTDIRAFTSRSVSPRNLTYLTTGGSTGVPVGFYHTRVNRWMEDAFMHAGWEWGGWIPDQKTLTLRGWFQGTPKRFFWYNPLRRELHLSTYYLTVETYPQYFQIAKQFAPLFIQAYPSAMTFFSRLILERGDAGVLQPRVIFLASETIYPWQRELIARAFPTARIFAHYGHTEQAGLGHWCEYIDQYHFWPFYGYLELLDSQGNPVPLGQVGEIVVTSFWNYGTPWIRYRTGDLGILAGNFCSACGRNFPIMSNVQGRIQEFLISQYGRIVSFTALNVHNDLFDHVWQFQFYQDTPGKVTLKLLPRSEFSENDLNRIQQEMSSKLGEDFSLETICVEQIPLTPRGKFKVIEQKCSLDWIKETIE
ncbi:hypothetical protein [Anaerolinea sp.]|uniref:phenylacetate--CoA ligase family protein n=1 Tax=Anaerolinea sp. TaxID=1872519 RepID=UPI002ACE96EB|nr:hypothetical protein [Anaerolinea sp.]